MDCHSLKWTVIYLLSFIGFFVVLVEDVEVLEQRTCVRVCVSVPFEDKPASLHAPHYPAYQQLATKKANDSNNIVYYFYHWMDFLQRELQLTTTSIVTILTI